MAPVQSVQATPAEEAKSVRGTAPEETQSIAGPPTEKLQTNKGPPAEGIQPVDGPSAEGDTTLCDPCNYGGTEKIAKFSCKDCDENLCPACSDLHKRQKMSRNHKLIPLSEATKQSGALPEPDINVNNSKKKMFPELKIESSRQIDIQLPGDEEEPFISGCAIMPDGHIILVDTGNSKIKMLDKSFKLKESLILVSAPRDVAMYNKTSVLVTLPDTNQLQYIEVSPKLVTGATIQLDKPCWGVAVSGNKIYVTCYLGFGREGEVRILDKNGKLENRLGVHPKGKSFMFARPFYLAVSPTSGRIFVTDWDRNSVICLGPDGSVVYMYKELFGPRGVCVLPNDNILVCDDGQDKVQVITAKGEKHSTLLTEMDGIMQDPYCVAYRQTDGLFLLGCIGELNLFVYTIK